MLDSISQVRISIETSVEIETDDSFFSRNDYKESLIPAHPCLKLIANSEQTLCGLTTRRLVTYEKIANYSPENTEAVVIDDALNVCFREK